MVRVVLCCRELARAVPAFEQPFLCSKSSKQIRNFDSSIAGALLIATLPLHWPC